MSQTETIINHANLVFDPVLHKFLYILHSKINKEVILLYCIATKNILLLEYLWERIFICKKNSISNLNEQDSNNNDTCKIPLS